MGKVTRTYNITKELSDRLHEASYYLKKPQSEIVRDAISKYLSEIRYSYRKSAGDIEVSSILTEISSMIGEKEAGLCKHKSSG